jgi:hypothetical protein
MSVTTDPWNRQPPATITVRAQFIGPCAHVDKPVDNHSAARRRLYREHGGDRRALLLGQDIDRQVVAQLPADPHAASAQLQQIRRLGSDHPVGDARSVIADLAEDRGGIAPQTQPARATAVADRVGGQFAGHRYQWPDSMIWYAQVPGVGGHCGTQQVQTVTGEREVQRGSRTGVMTGSTPCNGTGGSVGDSRHAARGTHGRQELTLALSRAAVGPPILGTVHPQVRQPRVAARDVSGMGDRVCRW